MNYKIVYTTGNQDYMLSDLRDSILSARRFVNKQDIILILTPPYIQEEYNILFNKLCTVIKKNKNYDGQFKMHPFNNKEDNRKFGDKLYMTDIDYPNILFLDCDTIVYNNPSKLFEEDIDFGGVVYDQYTTITPWQVSKNLLKITKNMFSIQTDKNLHLWNSGHLIFKNHTHQKIKDIWIKNYMKKEIFENISKYTNKRTDEELALTPTICEFPNLKVKIFMKEDIFKVGMHRDLWNSKSYCKEICIFHGDKLRELLNLDEELNKLEQDLI